MNDKIEKVYKDEYSKAISYIKRMIDSNLDDEEPEDIYHEVITKILEKSSITDSIENFTYYIFSSIKNKIIDYFRRKRNRKISLYSELYIDDTKVTLYDTIVDDVYNPDVLLERNEIFTEIYKAINELPYLQKEIFIQTEIENKSFREISKITGEPINTLIARKRYAIQKLRGKIKYLKENLC